MKNAFEGYYEIAETSMLVNFNNILNLTLIEASENWYIHAFTVNDDDGSALYIGTEKQCRDFLEYVKTNFNFFYETEFASLINLNNLVGISFDEHKDGFAVKGYSGGERVECFFCVGTAMKCNEYLKKLKKKLKP